MKYVGVLLIVAAGIGLGMFYSRRLYRRVEWLKQAERLLDALLGRLSYTAQPLATLWQTMADGEAFSRYSLVQDTAVGLRQGDSFAVAFGTALERAAEHGLLLPPEKQLLLEWSATLGQTGIAGQEAAIRCCRAQLAGQEAAIRCCRAQLADGRCAAEQLAAARGQVYQMMGVAGGVSLALLLL